MVKESKAKLVSVTATIPVAQYSDIRPIVEAEDENAALEYIAKLASMVGNQTFADKITPKQTSVSVDGMKKEYNFFDKKMFALQVIGEHIYLDESGNRYTGGSSLSNKYIDNSGLQFAKNATAKKLAKLTDIDEADSVKVIEDMWRSSGEKSRAWGDSVHAAIGHYVKYGQLCNSMYGDMAKVIPRNPVLKEIVEKVKAYLPTDKTLVSEAFMISKEFMLCGFADLLVIDEKTKEISIVDYKTNESLDDEVKYTTPLDKLIEQTTLGGYEIQLNAYAHIAEEYGYKIKALTILHIGFGKLGEIVVTAKNIRRKDIRPLLLELKRKKGDK